MKKFLSLLVVLALCASGCTTTECSSKRNADGTVTVTVAYKDSAIGGMVKGIGDKAITISQNGEPAESLLGLIRGASENGTLLDPGTQQKYADEGAKVAKDYVNQHSEEFCNSCPEGHACAAKLEEFKPEVTGTPSVQKLADGTVIVVISFKWAGAISCAECPDCVRNANGNHSEKSSQSEQTYCSGEQNIVLEPGVVANGQELSNFMND